MRMLFGSTYGTDSPRAYPVCIIPGMCELAVGAPIREKDRLAIRELSRAYGTNVGGTRQTSSQVRGYRD